MVAGAYLPVRLSLSVWVWFPACRSYHYNSPMTLLVDVVNPCHSDQDCPLHCREQVHDVFTLT